MSNIKELVFAFPTDKLWKLIPYNKQGLIEGNSEVLNTIVNKGLFRKRSELEEDPSFKQIIPYAIISNLEPTSPLARGRFFAPPGAGVNEEPCEGEAQERLSFYLFRRTSGQTEKRLHNKFTLGAGGHMNPGDPMKSKEHYLVDELKRELSEEVRMLNGCQIENIEFIGFINDDTIPVGRAHVGLLYNIRVSNKEVYINETDKMTAEWVEKSSLTEFYEAMETWSKIVFEFYIQNFI